MLRRVYICGIEEHNRVEFIIQSEYDPIIIRFRWCLIKKSLPKFEYRYGGVKGLSIEQRMTIMGQNRLCVRVDALSSRV